MTPSSRAASLDLFKSMLVVGMVSIHVCQLLGASMPRSIGWVSDTINLITFSGFMFALGIGIGMSRDLPRPWRTRLRPVVLLLAAAWLSSFAFVLLVERRPLTMDLALDVLTLRRLFGWSEFLASFFMLYVVLAIARPIVVRTALDNLTLGLALALAAASTWVIVDSEFTAAATLFGTRRFASFPLLPYFGWFLVGIRVGRMGGAPSAILWLAAAIASALFAWHVYSTGSLPGRFPPTVLWIAGCAVPLLVYWLGARALADRVAVPPFLLVPGRHVLGFLLASNLVIFAARYFLDRPIGTVAAWLAASLVLLAVIGCAFLLLEGRGLRKHGALEPVGKMAKPG